MTGVETALIIAAVASAAAAAGGAVVSGIQQAEAAEFQSELAERDAELARQTALANIADVRRRQRQITAAQRAAAGASGLVVEEGSPLEVITQTAEDAELDVMRVRFGGSIAQSQALARAEASRFEGQSALVAGGIGAGTRLLSGSTSVLETQLDTQQQQP